MARRRLSEATCREDARMAAAAAAIAKVLSERHPGQAALQMADRMLQEAHLDLESQADGMAERAAPAALAPAE